MLSLSAGGAISAPAGSPKEWTVLIYMNGKNSLEEAAIENFAQLAKVGSSKDVDFVVQLGRPKDRPDQQARMAHVFGGWVGARRFHVLKGSTPAPGQEQEIVGEGPDLDMGSPQTLTEFLKWGKREYPAKKYAVIIWNHGQGYRLTYPGGAKVASVLPVSGRGSVKAPAISHRAVSQDADTNSIIYNVDLRTALGAVFAGRELRLVGFDACLMGMIETAYELKDIAPVMVASEELEPGDGWNYTEFSQYLTDSPSSDEVMLATILVKNYGDDYGNSDSTTLSALRLGGAKALADEVSALGDSFLADKGRLFPIVRDVRSRRMAYNAPDNPVTIDLIGFLKALEPEIELHAPASPALTHVREARALAESMVLSTYASSLRQEPYGSYGIAIYFPATHSAFKGDYWSSGYVRSNSIKKIDFVVSERWSLFLQEYLGLPN